MPLTTPSMCLTHVLPLVLSVVRGGSQQIDLWMGETFQSTNCISAPEREGCSRRGYATKSRRSSLYTLWTNMRSALLCLSALVSAASGLKLSAAPVGDMTRRSAITGFLGGTVALGLPAAALAETCFGKCVDPDAERKKAERIALQTGTFAAKDERVEYSSGVDGLIERSIASEEQSKGAPLTEERKAQIAAKVRSLSSNQESSRKGKVKARFRTGEE